MNVERTAIVFFLTAIVALFFGLVPDRLEARAGGGNSYSSGGGTLSSRSPGSKSGGWDESGGRSSKRWGRENRGNSDFWKKPVPYNPKEVDAFMNFVGYIFCVILVIQIIIFYHMWKD